VKVWVVLVLVALMFGGGWALYDHLEELQRENTFMWMFSIEKQKWYKMTDRTSMLQCWHIQEDMTPLFPDFVLECYPEPLEPGDRIPVYAESG